GYQIKPHMYATIENLPTFLVELSKVLANPVNSQVARVASSSIKNLLTSKDPDVKAKYQHRWVAIDVNACWEIKSYVLWTLGMKNYQPSSASQCVAGIASAEKRVNRWPQLIPQLVANVSDPNCTEHIKELILECTATHYAKYKSSRNSQLLSPMFVKSQL
uniref:Importin N-terminal domain-containing protein n=1 Tax=Leptobrachium leishanense TaxID=445787 RepID=A0A8C5R8Z3_9ANUR